MRETREKRSKEAARERERREMLGSVSELKFDRKLLTVERIRTYFKVERNLVIIVRMFDYLPSFSFNI